MSETFNEIINLIDKYDNILIGAGSGLSTAAGIDYASDGFKKEFKSML